MKNNKKSHLTFKEAVAKTSEISNCYRTGLTALGSNSSCIVVSNSRLIDGSVEIDECTKKIYPQQNRWDYVISYNNEVFFIEIHTANTREVSTMENKLRWLKDWLVQKAPELNKLKAKGRNPYVWVQSNNFQIPKTSPQYRRIIALGLYAVKRLELK